MGKITRELATSDGRPVKGIKAPDPDGITLLEIEAGTGASDNVNNIVTLIEIRETQSPPLPKNTRLVGKAYEFKPSGTIFDKSIRLTFSYNVDELPDGVTSVGAAYYTSRDGWIYLPPESTSVAELGKLTAPVNHFTVFAVLATVTEAPAIIPAPGPGAALTPASFKLNNLHITPSLSRIFKRVPYIIITGKEVSITVDVTNDGAQRGNYAATLKINGTNRETKDAALEPGQTRTVSFTAAIDKPGSYLIQIGDLKGDFISELWINWWLWIASIAAFILLCWFVISRLKKRYSH
jgi:hypothetical protein